MSEQEIEQQNTVTDDNRMILRTENLVKKYGKRTVVSHVSFDVKQGEIVGLLGPNGAGKTTSFYMTTGLIVPNEGHIFLNDLDITSYPVYKRAQNGIGYLAQEASVFRKMSVEDNIASVLELTNTTPEYQKDKLESLIAEFRLQKVRKNLGDQLSGGERRRTEIARCLAIDPKFIMLDEPFAGVDPIAVEDIQHIVWKLKDKNIGILITDHNALETLRLTDRAYLLFEGKILFQGTPEELAENPVVREKYLGWFMGFTPSLVSGCWVGGEDRDIHFDTMLHGQGASMALPIWAKYMVKVLGDKSLGYDENETFQLPEGFDPCKDSGYEDADAEPASEMGLDDLFN